MTQTVLIADDDRAIRDSLGLALRLDGYSVLLADDGVAALNMLDLHQVDVLIIDLLMPRLDGVSTCRAMRARGDNTPVLVLTARTEPNDRAESFDAGADDFLVKPFDFAELAERLRRLLQGRSAGRGVWEP